MGVLVGAVVKWILNNLRKWYTYTRPIKRILDTMADDSQELRLYFEIFRGDTIIREEQDFLRLRNIQEITSVSAARCLAYVMTLFMSIRSDKGLKLFDSRDYPGLELDSNIICIGGSNTNEATKRVFEMEAWFPYKFEGEIGEKWLTVSRKFDRWYSTKEKDYGIVLKIRNPFAKEKWVLILAGLGTEATVGAGYYFKREIKSLAKRYGNKQFGVVIEVDRRLGYKSVKEVHSIPTL